MRREGRIGGTHGTANFYNELNLSYSSVELLALGSHRQGRRAAGRPGWSLAEAGKQDVRVAHLTKWGGGVLLLLAQPCAKNCLFR